jgi:hypothetical protein
MHFTANGKVSSTGIDSPAGMVWGFFKTSDSSILPKILSPISVLMESAAIYHFSIVPYQHCTYRESWIDGQYLRR